MNAPTSAPGLLSDVELPAGTVLADYELGRIVERRTGEYVLYEATAPGGQRVAVKLLSRALSQNRRFRDRFDSLLEKRAAIRHPNLLPVHGRGEFVDTEVPGTTCLYVVSDHADSPTLADLLDDGPLDPNAALRIAGQVADALDAVHARGLVHPQLTPADILVEGDEGGRVLLTDFLGGTATGAARSYRSPESGAGNGLTPASDVYALTVILTECLTGEAPGGPGAGPPNGLPPALSRVVTTGTARNPSERYPSCAELVAAAGRAIEGVAPGDLRAPRERDAGTAHAAADTGSGKQPLAWVPQETWPSEPRRLPSARLALAALAVGAALGLGVGALAEGGDESEPAPDRSGQAEAAATRERADVVERATGPVDRLLIARAAGRRRLARASRRSVQSATAARLSTAYATAARRLDAAGAPALARSAGRASRAYGRLAAAARAGSARRWSEARGTVRTADSELQAALREFRGAAG